MTCGPSETRYRILRASTFWTHDLVADGEAEIGATIRLRASEAEFDAIVDGRFFPPFLARGCSPCDWFLVIADAACPRRGLFRLIGGRWCELRPGGCPLELRPTAIATAGDRIAVLEGGRLLVLSPGARRVTRDIPFAGTGPIAIDGRGLIYAADGARLVIFDRDGACVREHVFGDVIERIAVDACGAVWVVIGSEVLKWTEGPPVVVTGDIALPATGVRLHTDGRFCITVPQGDDAPRTHCFDRCGRPTEIEETPAPPARRGIVATTQPIDSFTPRCRWHRLRLDADRPDGTSIVVRVATTESADETPHADDWQTMVEPDALFRQPAGRYLHLAIELVTSVAASPVIRAVHLDLPRSTSAEWLPAVYREAPESSDFVERFMAIFDATLEDLDRAIERFPALLDAARTPEHALPWLASLVGATLDAAWSVARRRALLARLPELYERRGTPEGLRIAIEALTGQPPVLEELGVPMPFGALAPDRTAVAGAARIGVVRLFGRGRARVRLGSSRLGATELKSYGNPDDDARTALAFRVRVQLPAAAGVDLPRFERMVDLYLPAHVVAEVRVGTNAGTAVGRAAAVGVDTLLAGLARPILGLNVRLRRASALWPGPSRGDAAISVGRAAVVGMQTILR